MLLNNTKTVFKNPILIEIYNGNDMNDYLKNLSKIEFVLTDACTGKCKHCSQGDHLRVGDKIDPDSAADAVRRIASAYDIKTVMTFGGEPLLHPEAVYAIMQTAKELGIPKRQVITNGYFTKDAKKMREMARELLLYGVNDLLISVDAFHQETIPLDTVRAFACVANRIGIPTRLQPAWLVSETDDNPYNARTREILYAFSDTGIAVSSGNVIFPEGNALCYLAEYFTDKLPENPYTEDPCDVRCISVGANGDVLDGNLYTADIMEIIKNYVPFK